MHLLEEYAGNMNENIMSMCYDALHQYEDKKAEGPERSTKRYFQYAGAPKVVMSPPFIYTGANQDDFQRWQQKYEHYKKELNISGKKKSLKKKKITGHLLKKKLGNLKRNFVDLKTGFMILLATTPGSFFSLYL